MPLQAFLIHPNTCSLTTVQPVKCPICTPCKVPTLEHLGSLSWGFPVEILYLRIVWTPMKWCKVIRAPPSSTTLRSVSLLAKTSPSLPTSELISIDLVYFHQPSFIYCDLPQCRGFGPIALSISFYFNSFDSRIQARKNGGWPRSFESIFIVPHTTLKFHPNTGNWLILAEKNS